MEKKPENVTEYICWLKEIHSINLFNYDNYYSGVVTAAAKSLELSNFWKALRTKWNLFNSNYYAKTNYQLFANEFPKIFLKPYSYFIEKTFRKNILNNSLFPEPPKDGWLMEDNWLGRINDILRTSIIVKYLDGVDFILNELIALSKECNLDFSYDYEAKDEGYYAVHFYIIQEFDIPAKNWDTIKQNFKIEIQITTQIKDVIKKLTHSFYENRRIQCSSSGNDKWQWNYKDEAFVANYLGHILHYLEGMIMDIREKEKEDGTKF